MRLRTLQKAKEKGISKVIVISGLSANVRGDSHLAMTEKAVRKGGLVATHLRLNWFMQNFITFFKPDIDRGLLELPAEDAKVSFIDVRDIAHCVVKLFEEPLNQERAISLTGPEALTHGDVVEIIGRASGRKIEYRSISEKAAREKFKKMGWGEESIEETIQLFEEMRAGACALITNEVEKIMGRLPTRFSKFASDYANHWRRTSLEGVRE